MVWKNIQKTMDTINSYYSFAVLLYVAALYIASHNRVFLFVAIAAAPLVAGWTGYLVREYMFNRNLKHGFRVLSHVMNYEIQGNGRYLFNIRTKLKAGSNRLMTYPIGYQWSGSSEGRLPRLADPSQKIIGVIEHADEDGKNARVIPYRETVSSETDWHYWFVGFDHALYAGEEVEIKYYQEFEDKKKVAKPYIFCLVTTPMRRLELNVKFPAGMQPKKVFSSQSKLSDRRHFSDMPGVMYDPEKQWATWVIDRPKFGRCYRIDWQ